MTRARKCEEDEEDGKKHKKYNFVQVSKFQPISAAVDSADRCHVEILMLFCVELSPALLCDTHTNV